MEYPRLIQEYGAEFEDVYECDAVKFNRIFNAFGIPHSSTLIWCNEDADVFRYLIQTQTGRVMGYKIMYEANIIDTDRFLVTTGTIFTSRLDKVPEYEKIGKRKLVKAMKELWHVKF